MTTELILLVGRETGQTQSVLETHADRLAARAAADDVEVATYEQEPIRELRGRFESIAAETVSVVPMCMAHNYDTLTDLPGALSSIPGTVRYCEPVGASPAVTEAIAERADECGSASNDGSLVLVGFGSSSKPHQRQTVDYHATRLRESGAYEEVVTCYLLQNPTVECVRYNVSTPGAVTVPLFVTPSEATERRIPDALELDRGGIQYADPLGTHPRVTDAVHAEVEKQRTLADDSSSPSFESGLTESQRPVATDGEGRPQ